MLTRSWKLLCSAVTVTWRVNPSSPAFFFSSRRRHTRSLCDCSSDVCSSDLFLQIDCLRRKGQSAEDNRSGESGEAHRRAGARSRESPERVPRRSAVEGRGGDPQERSQFAHTPPALGEGRLARHAPGHRERARNDRRGRPEGGPVHRGDRKNSGDVIGGVMKNSSILAAILFAGALGGAQAQGDKPAVVRLDPALDALVSPDAKLQLVKSGFGFTEGIIWRAKGRYLLLSDM